MGSMDRDDAFAAPPDAESPKGRLAVSWERAAELFAAALEMPASERKEWLAALTGIDEALRQEVASLLEADQNAQNFLIPRESEGGSE